MQARARKVPAAGGRSCRRRRAERESVCVCVHVCMCGEETTAAQSTERKGAAAADGTAAVGGGVRGATGRRGRKHDRAQGMRCGQLRNTAAAGRGEPWAAGQRAGDRARKTGMEKEARELETVKESDRVEIENRDHSFRPFFRRLFALSLSFAGIACVCVVRLSLCAVLLSLCAGDGCRADCGRKKRERERECVRARVLVVDSFSPFSYPFLIPPLFPFPLFLNCGALFSCPIGHHRHSTPAISHYRSVPSRLLSRFSLIALFSLSLSLSSAGGRGRCSRTCLRLSSGDASAAAAPPSAALSSFFFAVVFRAVVLVRAIVKKGGRSSSSLSLLCVCLSVCVCVCVCVSGEREREREEG